MELVIFWIIGTAITLAILFAVIRSAVRAALFDHYKTVRRFEASGEWVPVEQSWTRAPKSPTAIEMPAGPLKWWQR